MLPGMNAPRIVVIVGCLAALFCVAYPPVYWVHVADPGVVRNVTREWVWDLHRIAQLTPHIDLGQSALHLAVIGLVTGGLAVVLRKRSS